MSAETKPIDTTTVVFFEAMPFDKVATWRAVSAVGDRLTVGVRMLDRVEIANLLKFEDSIARTEEAGKIAIKSVQHGAKILDASAIPFAYFYALMNKVWDWSQTGADPFFVAPAES